MGSLLVGREHGLAELNRFLTSAQAGHGGLVLVAGEAGAGKTRLVEESLTRAGIRALRARAEETATLPYGPIIAVLREQLRTSPNGFEICGSLLNYLALLLPELDFRPEEGERTNLVEAIRCAVETIGQHGPTVILMDDLQWADNATLDILPILIETLEHKATLVIGIYRSDEIPRGHPLRSLRNSLRRLHKFHEIIVEPLDAEQTTVLAANVAGREIAPELATAVHETTQGLPLFVEELMLTLKTSGHLRPTPGGVVLTPGVELPIPESIRDAVLFRLDGLSDAARNLVQSAAIVGLQFDLLLTIDIAGTGDGLGELIQQNLIIEIEDGMAAFRHALTREAIYRDILWTRRRELHRRVAAHLERTNAPSALIAEHWLAAKEHEQARRALVSTAMRSCEIHAYRDAAEAANRALEMWPEGEEESERLEVLGQLGICAQLSGMLNDAARAWQEVAEGRQRAGETRQYAETQRQLATVYGLQGSWERALASRQAAAEAYGSSGAPDEAATERLAAAGHLHGAGNYTIALEIVGQALEEAGDAERQDLLALGLGLKGALLSKLGQINEGLEAAQTGLSLALQHNLTGAAAVIYQRLASISEQAADYNASAAAYQSAVDYCETQGVLPMERICLACLSVVLHKTGDWGEVIKLCKDVLDQKDNPPLARILAMSMLGLTYACRGQTSRARGLLTKSLAESQFNEMIGIEVLCYWGMALVSDVDRKPETVSAHCTDLLRRLQATEERHYVISPLRWAATFYAARGAMQEVNACAEALSHVATATGNSEALAGLAHVLGESALLNDDPAQAVEQFGQALELLDELDAPFERAETLMRAGVALAATGRRDAAAEQLARAHRIARRLGARPMAGQAAELLEDLGEQLEQRLGKRAAQGALTRRQMEVLRYIALGHTNQEIANELVLSTRTVDMHVRNILDRLDCRSRTEAVRKAGELGLLDSWRRDRRK